MHWHRFTRTSLFTRLFTSWIHSRPPQQTQSVLKVTVMIKTGKFVSSLHSLGNKHLCLPVREFLDVLREAGRHLQTDSVTTELVPRPGE